MTASWKRTFGISLLALVVLAASSTWSAPLAADDRTSETDAELRGYLGHNPEADTNGDGILTESEMLGHRTEGVLEKLPEGTRHEHLMMPLSDGVKLATDVFLPAGDGPWPTVLLRTPYVRWDPRAYQAMGIPCAMVLQNQRGRYGSEGELPPESFDNEIADSRDAIEWIADQPWSDGKVAMWGPSGHGIAASQAVWSGAPHLTAVSVNVTGGNAYLYWLYSNGVRRGMYRWLTSRSQRVTDWPRPTTRPFDLEGHKAFIARQAEGNQTVYIGSAGWYDLFSEAALDAFAALGPNDRCYVRVSAGGHGAVGGLEFPRKSTPRVDRLTLAGVMTGKQPAEDYRSTLLYYLMGDVRDAEAPGNVWKVAHQWPVEHTPTPYYLRADKTLSTTPPAEADATLRYAYDPRDPAPSYGGNFGIGKKSGPKDQSPLAERDDVLRFVTPELDEPVGITGKVRVELAFSTDVPDTCFVAKLVDVYPDGYEAIVRESAMMGRYWGGLNDPSPLEKGKVYTLDMDLWSTALVFNRGHRIGLYVTSSSEEAYEVHPNSYVQVESMDDAPVAHQQIHLSKDHPSRLILPVIPSESYMEPKD